MDLLLEVAARSRPSDETPSPPAGLDGDGPTTPADSATPGGDGGDGGDSTWPSDHSELTLTPLSRCGGARMLTPCGPPVDP
eukprot:6427098-Pyramimonas_sp.AAC.1